jgi:hypothetical protein
LAGGGEDCPRPEDGAVSGFRRLEAGGTLDRLSGDGKAKGPAASRGPGLGRLESKEPNHDRRDRRHTPKPSNRAPAKPA